jgi:hypothetical protein
LHPKQHPLLCYQQSFLDFFSRRHSLFSFCSIFHFHYLKEEIKGNDDEKKKPRKIVGNTRMDAALDAMK